MTVLYPGGWVSVQWNLCLGVSVREGVSVRVVALSLSVVALKYSYRSGTVKSNTVNSKFHLIQIYCEIFVYNCPNISCLKYTVNSNFHLIRSKTLPTNDFELTVPDLYI